MQFEKPLLVGTMPIATYGLIVLNAVISLFAAQSFKQNRFEYFVFTPYLVSSHKKGFVGMILSNFSHADLFHFIFNMYTLHSFGSHLEYLGGTGVFVLIYLLSTIGSIIAVYISKRKESTYRCLGASGSVSGVLYASIVYAPAGQVLIFGLLPLSKILYAFLFVGLSIYMARKAPMGIAHEAHLGGAVTGFITAALISPAGLHPFLQSITTLGYI